jgi:hypothetical protein
MLFRNEKVIYSTRLLARARKRMNEVKIIRDASWLALILG